MAMRALDDSIAAYHGDRRRLYLTGLSMGGYGAWQIALDHPGMFAAAAIICGGIHPPNDTPTSPNPSSVAGWPCWKNALGSACYSAIPDAWP